MVLSTSSAIPETPSPQVRLALKWMESMTDGNLEGLASTMADNYIHTVCPASVGIPDIRGKEAYLENARRVMNMFVQNTVSDPCLHDLDGCLHVALCIMKATILDITESPGVVMLHVR